VPLKIVFRNRLSFYLHAYASKHRPASLPETFPRKSKEFKAGTNP